MKLENSILAVQISAKQPHKRLHYSIKHTHIRHLIGCLDNEIREPHTCCTYYIQQKQMYV